MFHRLKTGCRAELRRPNLPQVLSVTSVLAFAVDLIYSFLQNQMLVAVETLFLPIRFSQPINQSPFGLAVGYPLVIQICAQRLVVTSLFTGQHRLARKGAVLHGIPVLLFFLGTERLRLFSHAELLL